MERGLRQKKKATQETYKTASCFFLACGRLDIVINLSASSSAPKRTLKFSREA